MFLFLFGNITARRTIAERLIKYNFIARRIIARRAIKLLIMQLYFPLTAEKIEAVRNPTKLFIRNSSLHLVTMATQNLRL